MIACKFDARVNLSFTIFCLTVLFLIFGVSKTPLGLCTHGRMQVTARLLNSIAF